MIVMGVGFVFAAALFAYWQVSSRPRDGAPGEQAPDTLRVALKDTAAPPQDSVPVQSVNKVPEYGPETRAIDVAVSAQGQPGAPVAVLEAVKNRAENVSVAAVQQCENTEDPNVNRRECP
jgi:hypothetical protein